MKIQVLIAVLALVAMAYAQGGDYYQDPCHYKKCPYGHKCIVKPDPHCYKPHCPKIAVCVKSSYDGYY